MGVNEPVKECLMRSVNMAVSVMALFGVLNVLGGCERAEAPRKPQAERSSPKATWVVFTMPG